MTILEATGCFLLMVTAAIMLLGTISGNRRISYKDYEILLFLMMLGVLILVYEFDPRETIRFDINEHYKTLDLIKQGGWKYAFTEGEYKSLVVTTLYYYLISWIGNYRLLPILPLITEFLIFRYILFDQLHRKYPEKIPFADVSFIVYTWTATIGIMLAITGIRCVWAISIAVLAVYREYIKEKKGALEILLYIIPVFIHTFALIVPVIRCLIHVKRKKLMLAVLMICMVSGPYAISFIANFLGFNYLKYMLMQALKYWTNRNVIYWFRAVSNSTRTIYICFVIIIAFLFYILHEIKKQKKYLDAEDDRIIKAADTIAYCSIAVLYNYLFLERYMYMIAFLFVLIMPLYHIYRIRTLNNQLINIFSCLVMLWQFFFHDIYIFLVNFTGVYFLAS